MFEETGVQNFHVDRIRGRVKLVTIQATSDGTSLTIDTANTNPGVTVTGTGGDYVFAGISTGTFLHFVGGGVLGPASESAGSAVYPEAMSASAGTAGIETSITPGTAAAPANGSRVFVTYLVGRTG